MEAVMNLQNADWKPGSFINQAAAVILLVVFAALLYLSGLRQEKQEVLMSGRVYPVETALKPVEIHPDLPDFQLTNKLFIYPKEMKLKDILVQVPEKSELSENRTISGDKVVSACPETEAKAANKPDHAVPETLVPLSVHVKVYGNGGLPEITELRLTDYNLDISKLEVPRRLGKVFDGWYTDTACLIPFTGIAEGSETVQLYAGWKEFPGFICNDSGYITGYSDKEAVTLDDTVILPSSEECLGVEANAFSGLEDNIFEIYIPPNITYIAPGAFDGLYNLFYIKVAEGNPSYYDEAGILYNRDGTVALWPAGRSTEE